MGTANGFIIVTEDSSPRSDEAHQEGVRRRLLYLHELMTIYPNQPILSSNTSFEKYCKN